MHRPDRELTVRAGTASICCRMFGEHGPRLVLLHGNGGDYSVFERQLGAFSQHCRVIAIDSRGHGSSSLGDEQMVAKAPSGRIVPGLSLTRMAKDTTAVLDALRIDQTSVLGFGGGGAVALYLALLWPERVERLILAGTALSPRGLQWPVRLGMLAAYGACRAFSGLSAAAEERRQILGLTACQPALSPAQLGAICAPTLVMAAQHDLVQRRHSQLIARSIEGAQLCLVPHARHDLFASAPGLVAEKVLQFVLQADAQPGRDEHLYRPHMAGSAI